MVLCLLDIYLFFLDKLIFKIFSSPVFRILWLRSIHLSGGHNTHPRGNSLNSKRGGNFNYLLKL